MLAGKRSRKIKMFLANVLYQHAILRVENAEIDAGMRQQHFMENCRRRFNGVDRSGIAHELLKLGELADDLNVVAPLQFLRQRAIKECTHERKYDKRRYRECSGQSLEKRIGNLPRGHERSSST